MQVKYNCVFNDILQLDFNKFRSSLDEFNEDQKRDKVKFEEEHKNDNEKYELKVDERVLKITEFLKKMSRAAEYARNSRSWI